MSLHKLSAGDGYSYLTRQVAAFDATERGHTGLSDYYSQRGESPGRWLGSALGDVDLQDGQEVSAAQMAALFGVGKHPNADAITEQVMDKRAGGSGRLQGCAGRDPARWPARGDRLRPGVSGGRGQGLCAG